MVKIKKITPSTITLEGVAFSDGEKIEQILEICHKYKHMYKDGYPCGRKARKAQKKRHKKWAECPEICFTYLMTNDTDHHLPQVVVLVSDEEALLERYSKEDIERYLQRFTLDVADEIVEKID